MVAGEPRDTNKEKAKPKNKLKRQPSEKSSTTGSLKPPRLPRHMLKLLGKTRKIKARNYNPDGPYKKYRSPKRALASQEQEQSAACKKCWRMSQRLMINRKKRRNAVIMLEKFRGKAMGYDELERKLEEKDRRIAELERSSIDNSHLEQKMKEMEEQMKEKDRKIAELNGVSTDNVQLVLELKEMEEQLKKKDARNAELEKISEENSKQASKTAKLETQLKKSQRTIRELEKEAEQEKSSDSVKLPDVLSKSSQTQTTALDNSFSTAESTKPKPTISDNDQVDLLKLMKEQSEELSKLKDDLVRTTALLSISDMEISLLVPQKLELKEEVELLKRELTMAMAAKVDQNELEALRERDKIRSIEMEELKRKLAVTEMEKENHRDTIVSLVQEKHGAKLAIFGKSTSEN